MNLSPAQEQIVKSPISTAIQVIASAGSGKTRILTERVRYILEHTVREWVIALTFTNKAAEEMKTRLSNSDQAEERAWIATIHSVAQRILENYAHTIGLPRELHIFEREADRMEVFMQLLLRNTVNLDLYLKMRKNPRDQHIEEYLQERMNIFSEIKRNLFSESEIKEKYSSSEEIWQDYQDYQQALIDSGGIDYDDILVYAHKILMDNEWIAEVYRSRYKHLCVDEAQDLNKAQYEFIKVFCGDSLKSVLMVGDPRQMVYGFNGSSQDYLYKNFVHDFAPLQFELKENYRSTKSVIKTANSLMNSSQNVHEYALEGRVHIEQCESEESEAEFVTSTISDLLEQRTHEEIEGEISLDKMVVIARNKFVFSELKKSLDSKNIPYSLKNGERQVEPSTVYGKVLDYAIRLKVNPKDWVNGEKLCKLVKIQNPVAWTDGVLEILARSISSLSREDSQRISNLVRAVNELNIEYPNISKLTRNLLNSLNSVISNVEQVSNDLSEDIKLSIAEVQEFAEAWTNFKLKNLGESLQAFRSASAMGYLVQHPINTGLTLSTVHTMKGLEKDIVFLIGMCEGVFPDYRAQAEKEIVEERNNAFVAITRAKRWLYITYPQKRTMPWGNVKTQRISRFVEKIEKCSA